MEPSLWSNIIIVGKENMWVKLCEDILNFKFDQKIMQRLIRLFLQFFNELKHRLFQSYFVKKDLQWNIYKKLKKLLSKLILYSWRCPQNCFALIYFSGTNTLIEFYHCRKGKHVSQFMWRYIKLQIRPKNYATVHQAFPPIFQRTQTSPFSKLFCQKRFAMKHLQKT